MTTAEGGFQITTSYSGHACTGDTYCTITESDIYSAQQYDGLSWSTLDNDKKYRALVQATLLLDRLAYYGTKTSETQKLQFPRNKATSINSDIKRACFLVGWEISKGYNPEEVRNYVTSEAFGAVRATYDPQFRPVHEWNGIPSATAWALLRPYLSDAHSIRLYRV